MENGLLWEFLLEKGIKEVKNAILCKKVRGSIPALPDFDAAAMIHAQEADYTMLLLGQVCMRAPFYSHPGLIYNTDAVPVDSGGVTPILNLSKILGIAQSSFDVKLLKNIVSFFCFAQDLLKISSVCTQDLLNVSLYTSKSPKNRVVDI